MTIGSSAMAEVAIIGCGPAGMLAAHAVVRAGHTPVIFSKTVERSPHARAVFLHHAIPDLTADEPDGQILFHKVGNGHGYAQKVYGDPEAPTSWEKFDAGHIDAWALAPVYADLWCRYSGMVKQMEAGPDEITALLDAAPVVINTAPLPDLCNDDKHVFPSRPIWIRDDLPHEVLSLTNTMMYSGQPHHDWYRCSDLFGTTSTEFAGEQEGARKGIKVLPTSCDCHPAMFRAGRWGRWTPGVLLHHAYFQAERALDIAALAGRLR